MTWITTNFTIQRIIVTQGETNLKWSIDWPNSQKNNLWFSPACLHYHLILAAIGILTTSYFSLTKWSLCPILITYKFQRITLFLYEPTLVPAEMFLLPMLYHLPVQAVLHIIDDLKINVRLSSKVNRISFWLHLRHSNPHNTSCLQLARKLFTCSLWIVCSAHIL